MENNEDFEYKVSKEVTKQIKGLINTWGKTGSIIIGFIVTLIGFLGFKGGGYYIREYVKDTIQKEYSKIGQKQNRFILNSQLEEIRKQDPADKENNEVHKLFLEKIKQKIDDVIATEDQALITEYLDYLIRLNFWLRDYKEITSIVKKYGKDYPLSSLTWANVAIANMDLYELYGAKEYENASIETCEKALDATPGYGVAQAVKLIIGIIDYDKAKSQEEKDIQQKTIMKILREVNSGSLTTTSYETFEYFDRVGERFKKYVDRLFKIFPEEMKERYSK